MTERVMSKVIGERIRKLRKERGLSQEELAHLSSLHPTYIGQLERGEKNATIDTIEKVTKALEISLEELFRFATLNDRESEKVEQLKRLLHRISEDDQDTIMKIINVMLEWKDRTRNHK
ncbi:helix-turn-helix domain-containing protein [Aquibacillus sp. 3ASR75-11]|uniref:Helix-turn-helix domain-containing protein n=1 Tax=Terrihalobacillus insolitus TaxID=2950438 RepID=A0A9X4AMW4_9BACI|nr:helix-turn-helix transcriptional regulator [Terrihalobacillus insolitus]MDC3413481.1 helix-turn-helix domain-containing protein [Terrihalobacillus insolitus]MDC3425229.1 helix-turn-helix domain-containing protein [Terrihalobacillus insolitus]